MKPALALLALLCLALPASAQRRPEPLLPPRVEWSVRDTAETGPRRQRSTAEARIASRMLTAGGGLVLGFFGGAALGATLSGATGDDDLLPIILGASGGAMLLGGIGAGFPEYGGRCTRTERTLRGTLGVTASTIAALLLVSELRNELVDGVAIVGVPLGAAVAADC